MGRVLLAAALLVTLVAPALAQTNLAYVTRVAEGDLIYADVGGRIETIRYLGINVPVVDHPTRGREPYATVVRERNRQLVDAQWVRLAFEREPRDSQGRLAAYVWVRDVFVNAALLYYGYAEAAPPAPAVRYAEYFKGLEDGARRERRGLWRYGDVLAYYRPGGLEKTGDTDYQGRRAIGAGGRVFSAPAPFVPSYTTGSPGAYGGTSSSSTVAPPAPSGSRTMPSGTRGTGAVIKGY